MESSAVVGDDRSTKAFLPEENTNQFSRGREYRFAAIVSTYHLPMLPIFLLGIFYIHEIAVSISIGFRIIK
jgi:hypothetical protein